MKKKQCVVPETYLGAGKGRQNSEGNAGGSECLMDTGVPFGVRKIF